MSQAVHKFYFSVLILTAFYVDQQASEEVLQAEPKNFNPHVILGDRFYYIGLYQKVNWYRAALNCALQGMSLAFINSNAENEALRKFLAENDILVAQYWLSGNDLAKTSDYYWLADGYPLSFTNWARRQPNNANGSKHCVQTLADFKWSVESCLAEHYFICVEPVKPPCGVLDECQKRT